MGFRIHVGRWRRRIFRQGQHRDSLLAGARDHGDEPGSTTYRNAPDVSGNANFTFYVCADQTTCTANEYGGTSFAAPMWAGYMALVNQQALPTAMRGSGLHQSLDLYLGLGSGYGAAFHDITSGSNGYSAITGYDLATGWGSMNGAGLIAALAGAPSAPNFALSYFTRFGFRCSGQYGDPSSPPRSRAASTAPLRFPHRAANGSDRRLKHHNPRRAGFGNLGHHLDGGFQHGDGYLSDHDHGEWRRSRRQPRLV